MTKKKREDLLADLRTFDIRADAIRRDLKIGKPGEEIFQWECGDIDEDLIVEADGYGGACLQHVEGDGDNRLVHNSKDYPTEREACDVANRIMEGELEMEDVFVGSGIQAARRAE